MLVWDLRFEVFPDLNIVIDLVSKRMYKLYSAVRQHKRAIVYSAVCLTNDLATEPFAHASTRHLWPWAFRVEVDTENQNLSNQLFQTIVLVWGLRFL